MNRDKVKLLIREGEGLTVEFKEKYTSRIDEDIVAFANARGGTLLLGVRDDGTVVGEHLSNDLKAKINSLGRNCKPSISVEMEQVGDVVAVVVREGAEKPYSCGSGYYRRLDGNTQKVSHDELRIMFAENDPLPFEEKTVKGFTFDDVSKAKIRAFTKEAGIRIGSTAVPDFLRSLKVADETRVKNAGILFFARDVHDHLHQAQMTLLAFKGTDRFHIYDRRDVRDDLLIQFNEAVAFLKKHLNVRSEIRGVNREDIYEIPLEVLREALVNALMHRDYSITGTQVSVEVYDDRVEIVNPGGLPKGLSIRDLGTVSIRRNELIADPFFRLHKVERIGMGIRKMKEAMVSAGLREPTFATDAFFRATFQRSPEFALKEGKEGLEKRFGEKLGDGWEELVERLEEKLGEKLREGERNILRLIHRNKRVSIREMAREVGISTTAIDKNLTKLKNKGILRRVGPDKGGHWEVIE
ncbi:MAG: ATP-binding protein [Thermodesulfobacteriota bacterium]